MIWLKVDIVARSVDHSFWTNSNTTVPVETGSNLNTKIEELPRLDLIQARHLPQVAKAICKRPWRALI
ncbi:hypothetical protein CFIMG_001856RA [Ceratocystis fimbriata CBS 114723]|uniref:Uncharacterized protein n=1 Tax=Ceratocystis fimbriata CBS 114723 TaxID=1035309 RepID=A0A2C5X3Z6_9PEZI|nr:hypothetical protein CFIMG_001856RA [Ceratocystis fimbriata CBS 114723]